MAILGVFAALLGYAYFRHSAPEYEGEVNGPDDVRRAAEALSYKSRSRKHPIECIDDPQIAASAIVFRITEREGMLSAQEIAAALAALQAGLQVDAPRAEALATLGHWVAAQHFSQEKALRHLCKRCRALSGATLLPAIIEMSQAIATAERSTPHPNVQASLDFAAHLLAGTTDETPLPRPRFVSDAKPLTHPV